MSVGMLKLGHTYPCNCVSTKPPSKKSCHSRILMMDETRPCQPATVDTPGPKRNVRGDDRPKFGGTEQNITEQNTDVRTGQQVVSRPPQRCMCGYTDRCTGESSVAATHYILMLPRDVLICSRIRVCGHSTVGLEWKCNRHSSTQPSSACNLRRLSTRESTDACCRGTGDSHHARVCHDVCRARDSTRGARGSSWMASNESMVA